MAGIMGRGILEAKWKEIRGAVKSEWPQLSDDELDRIDGYYDQLVAVLKETYGYTTEKARQEVDRFIEKLDDQMDDDAKMR